MSQSRADEDPQRKAFAAQLLEALQAAEEASQRPKSSLQLAQQAYERLQFDFPVSGCPPACCLCRPQLQSTV